jgi:hypothetical protein
LRFILRYLPPFVLWLTPIAIIRAEALAGHGFLLVLACAHVLGCYWMLYALKNPDPPSGARGKLVALRLLVGAPLTIWLLADVAAALAGGVPEAEWIGFVGPMAFMVWPAILLGFPDRNRNTLPNPSASNQDLMVAKSYLAPFALWSGSIAALPFLSLAPPAIGPWIGPAWLAAHLIGACWTLVRSRGRRDLLALRILVGLPTTAVFGLGLWQSRTTDTVWMVLPIVALIALVIWGTYWATRAPRSPQI